MPSFVKTLSPFCVFEESFELTFDIRVAPSMSAFFSLEQAETVNTAATAATAIALRDIFTPYRAGFVRP